MHLFVTRFHYFIQALEQLSRVSILIVCLLDTTEEAQRQCQNVSNSENELSRSTYLDIFARRPTPKKNIRKNFNEYHYCDRGSKYMILWLVEETSQFQLLRIELQRECTIWRKIMGQWPVVSSENLQTGYYCLNEIKIFYSEAKGYASFHNNNGFSLSNAASF